MSPLIPLLLAFATPQASDHSQRHPAEAVVYLQCSDIPALVDVYLESRWADVAQDAAVREGIAHAMDMDVPAFIEWIQSVQEELDADERRGRWKNHLVGLRAVSASISILDGDPLPVFLAVTGSEGGDMSGLEPTTRSMLILEFKDEPSARLALADGLQHLDLEESSQCVRDGNFVVIHVGSLAIGDGPGPSLAQRWGSLGLTLGEPQGTTLFEGYSGLGDQLVQQLDERFGYSLMDGPVGQALTSVLGAPLVAITRGGAWRVCAKDGQFCTSGRYPHRDASIVDEVFGSLKLKAEDLAFIHPDAYVGGAISINQEVLVPWAESLLAMTGPELDLAQFEEQYGFQPIRDLIEPLGGSAHWSLQGKLGLGVPPTQMSIRVHDQAAMERGIKGLAHWVEVNLADSVQVKIQRYKQVELVTFSLAERAQKNTSSMFDPSLMIRPTLAVYEGRVILTPNKVLAKREIKRLKKSKGKADVLPTALKDGLGDVTSGAVAFGDWMGILGKVLKLSKSFGSMAGAVDLPFDLERLPAPELITRHFSPSFETRTRFEDGVHYESRSFVGPESTAALLSGMGFVAMAMLPGLEADVRQAEANLRQAEANARQAEANLSQAEANARQMEVESAKFGLALLALPLQMYQLQNGGLLPDSLVRLVEPDAQGRMLMASPILPKDPWGSDYRYDPEAKDPAAMLWSCGPDRIDDQGQGDDIVHERAY